MRGRERTERGKTEEREGQEWGTRGGQIQRQSDSSTGSAGHLFQLFDYFSFLFYTKTNGTNLSLDVHCKFTREIKSNKDSCICGCAVCMCVCVCAFVLP